MKHQITITGQVSGNYKIYNKLGSDGLVGMMKGTFNSIIVFYSTKKQAKNALSVAYQSIIAEESCAKEKTGSVIYGRGSHLMYDASSAAIYQSI